MVSCLHVLCENKHIWGYYFAYHLYGLLLPIILFLQILRFNLIFQLLKKQKADLLRTKSSNQLHSSANATDRKIFFCKIFSFLSDVSYISTFSHPFQIRFLFSSSSSIYLFGVKGFWVCLFVVFLLLSNFCNIPWQLFQHSSF